MLVTEVKIPSKRSNTSSSSNKHTKLQYMLLIGCSFSTISAGYVLWSFVAPAFRRICLPYIPATPIQIENVKKLLEFAKKINQDQSLGSVIELGSGDGRVLINLLKNSQFNFRHAHGIELNRPLVWYSNMKRIQSGFKKSELIFKYGNIWSTNLSSYQIVLLFGVDTMMKGIEEKVLGEMTPNSFVITARYTFPNLKPLNSIICGPHSVYLYKI